VRISTQMSSPTVASALFASAGVPIVVESAVTVEQVAPLTMTPPSIPPHPPPPVSPPPEAPPAHEEGVNVILFVGPAAGGGLVLALLVFGGVYYRRHRSSIAKTKPAAAEDISNVHIDVQGPSSGAPPSGSTPTKLMLDGLNDKGRDEAPLSSSRKGRPPRLSLGNASILAIDGTVETEDQRAVASQRSAMAAHQQIPEEEDRQLEEEDSQAKKERQRKEAKAESDRRRSLAAAEAQRRREVAEAEAERKRKAVEAEAERKRKEIEARELRLATVRVLLIQRAWRTWYRARIWRAASLLQRYMRGKRARELAKYVKKHRALREPDYFDMAIIQGRGRAILVEELAHKRRIAEKIAAGKAAAKRAEEAAAAAEAIRAKAIAAAQEWQRLRLTEPGEPAADDTPSDLPQLVQLV